MKRIAVVLALLFAPVPRSVAAEGSWLRALPGSGRSGCCYGLAADSRGGVWFLGSAPDSDSADLDGTALAGHGDADALLVHVTAAGRADRGVVVGGAGADDPVELAVGPDDAAYALVRFGADARIGGHFFPVAGDRRSGLLRFEPDGRCSWAVEVPGTGEDGAQAVAVDRSGAAVVAGTFVRPWARGDLPEIYAAKYGRDGGRVWLRRCEGTGRTVCVDTDGQGRVYLGAATAAAEPGAGRRPVDGWPLVLSFDARGATRWRWEPERPSDSGDVWGRVIAIAAEPDGGCRVLGEVRGLVRIGEIADPELRERDLFLARLDADGALRWSQRFGGPGDDFACDLAPGPDGVCAVTGTFRGAADLEPWSLTSAAPEAGFASVWDENGGCIWARVLEGPGSDRQEVLPYEVSVTADGASYVAGWYRDAVRLGELSLPGPHDGVFLARILPGGATR